MHWLPKSNLARKSNAFLAASIFASFTPLPFPTSLNRVMIEMKVTRQC